MARGRGRRLVGSDGRHVGEEGTLLGAVGDECSGRPTDYVGLVLAIFSTEVPDRAVVVYVVVEVVGVAGSEIGEPSIPSLGPKSGLRVAVQVLAEEPCSVACLLQARGHVVFLVAIG